MKILFLYSEIAQYFLACSKALLNEGAEVHIVRFPVNKEAPFQFTFPSGIHIYERNKFNDQQLLELVNTIQPSIIVCSGWIDKGYLNVCKKYKGIIPTVLTLDNHWRGDLKQWIAKIISPFYLLRRFSNCWVPGDMQYEYALKLGFKKNTIFRGFYSCDYDLFHDQYLNNNVSKKTHFPKRFIFVGRYYEFKGIKDLWNAFINVQQQPNDWELWCLGTGDLEPIDHPKIKHFGFVQPAELSSYINQTGVFVLPSHFEPWGVVVQEFAAAGFPLICSDEVGAKTVFVENNYNGYIYKSGNIIELEGILKRIMLLSDAELNVMAERSAEKAGAITPKKWADTLLSLIKK